METCGVEWSDVAICDLEEKPGSITEPGLHLSLLAFPAKSIPRRLSAVLKRTGLKRTTCPTVMDRHKKENERFTLSDVCDVRFHPGGRISRAGRGYSSSTMTSPMDICRSRGKKIIPLRKRFEVSG